MSLALWIIAPAALLLGGVAGYLIRKNLAQKLVKNQEEKAKSVIDEAKEKEKEILIAAKDQALKIREEAEGEAKSKQRHLFDLENSLRKKEELLDRRTEVLDSDKRELSAQEEKVRGIKKQLNDLREQQLESLEKISSLTKEEAKEAFLKLVEEEEREEAVKRIKSVEEEAKEEADKNARKITATAIARLASEQTAEATVVAVPLPSEEMKGRIIGREGRNIRAFEKAAGVDVIVDDTPEAVVISCFDPVRRQIARRALDSLVVDGRIHPARIEEALEKAKKEVTEEVNKAGEEAAYEIGVAGINRDLIKILGRLKFRTSYGQNVLRHSVEVANIAGVLAEELGANVSVAKRAGLFHDIGKAIDHDVPGSHAQISADISKKYGLSDEIVHAIRAHHEEEEMKTVEALIVHAADAISGARPGARRETVESYIKRLEGLENVANSFKGVEKAYAIQAGREIRIIVKPEEIDDLDAIKLSRKIAKKIEEELEYPGQIKVNVMRETRATEFAK